MEYLLALIVFASMIALMSVGVIFSNRCIKGTCGGLNTMIDKDGNKIAVCETCGEIKSTVTK